MPIKFEKDILQIVNSDDIYERLELSCRLIAKKIQRNIIMKNRADQEEDQIKGKDTKKLKDKIYETFKWTLQFENGAVSYTHDPLIDEHFKQIHYKDLNEINEPHIEIEYFTRFTAICGYLVFTKDINKRKQIYNVLNKVDCFKMSSYKSPYRHNTATILCI